MVSADNLNIDVLELIFSFLSGNDLHSVALVSHSFYDGVLPRLYRTLRYTMRHGKKFPRPCSPFTAILNARNLAKFVHHVDICYVPSLTMQGTKQQYDPHFLKDCRNVLGLCQNLVSFTCIWNVLPSLLPGLEGLESIQDLRVYASELKPVQVESLLKIQNLHTVFLDHSSWAVMDVLPRWTQSLSATLNSLTLYNCLELNETVFGRALENLPNLLSLHVVGCPRIDYVTLFRLLSRTPLLENLSFTTFESSKALEPAPSLQYLRQLCIDTRYSVVASPVPTMLGDIFNHLKGSVSTLSSFKIRISEPQVVAGPTVIDHIVASHAYTLKRLAFINCNMKLESLTSICKSCVNLERLDVCIPNFKDPLTQARFIDALSRSRSLRILVDTDDHTAHGAHFVLRQADVEKIMKDVPQLTTVVSDNKRWTRRLNSGKKVTASMERIKTRSRTPTLWFTSTE
ncbi:hypothetical protein BDZ89DRAFT_1064760 [Hymenopellis radicata]|nr:hypothetical protein BDZ89DRAFT_1064760 [Hymenopellis radicata]